MAMPPASSMPASSRAKCAGGDVQLDVDEMMLEYLVYMATKALIAERKAQRRYRNAAEGENSASDMPLNLVNSFLPVFHANYPSHTIGEASQFRLRLLQFSTLFTQRLWPLHSTPPTCSLEQLRQRNRTRADTWLRHHRTPTHAQQDFSAYNPPNALPFPQDVLSHHRSTILAQHFNAHSKPLHGEPHFYGSPASVSLRDTLPAFMALSAHMTASFEAGSVTDTWIQFAGQYMLQAALEAYLVYGESGDGALRECFAWGFDPDGGAEAEGGDGLLVNAMFYHDDEGVRERWTQARDGFLRILTPSSSHDISLQDHLEDVARRYPLATFETHILKYLKALLDCNDPPVLAQLETGSLAGYSREEAAGLSGILGFRVN